jgi:SAM-dependent methyltransferase
MTTTPRGDAEYLFDDLVAAEAWHFWFRARRTLVLWALRKYFPACRSVIDVGCGTGFVVQELQRTSPTLRVVGCDILHQAVSTARRRQPDLHLFQGDVLRLSVQRQFDVIAALDVIEHLDDDEGALSEIFRTLQDGGGLIVTVPQHQWLWSQIDDFSHHRRRYDRAGLLGKLRAAGFEVLHCTSFFLSTLPLMVLGRFSRRDGACDPAAELRISRAANALAGALLRPEWFLLRAGASLPIGGSLMAIARRPVS